MAYVNYESNAEDVRARFVRAADIATGKVAIEASSLIRSSMPGPGASASDSKNRGTGSNDIFVPSNPGTPPGVRTGTLQRSIVAEKIGAMRWVVSTNLKYAAIHEYGGTINHPGGTPYIMTEAGPRYISNDAAARMESEGKKVGRTRPHTINMPARPFFAPTIAASAARLRKRYAEHFRTIFTGGI